MSKVTLSLKTGVASDYGHDDSVVIHEDGDVVFGCESERISREKHSENGFPERTIRIALSQCGLELSDVDKIATTYDPRLEPKRFVNEARSILKASEGVREKWSHLLGAAKHFGKFSHGLAERVERDFARLGSEVPEIELYPHHECHAASAYYPSGFDEAVVVTLDGIGEYESTTVWIGRPDGLRKVASYETPNSLGSFYSIVTYFLGFRPNNGEGKVMGLAPYGEPNPEIRATLRDLIEVGVNYDVTGLTEGIVPDTGVQRLTESFGRERNSDVTEFDQFQKDLAYATQRILEDIVTDIVEHYCDEFGIDNVCLAGGVALNCKMNKVVAELDTVGELFVQPVANDAGVALGAGMLEYEPEAVPRMKSVYVGPSFSTEGVKRRLSEYKIPYSEPDDLAGTVARMLADGNLVGWYQGRMEMGPRALGNRSILADPREPDARRKVNRHVKGREEWRPFAPSILEDRADEYLQNYRESPFMIDTFDVVEEKRSEMQAVVHPADGTTRPQTVRKEQNPQYYRLLSAFEELTGVPVLLNTSFNRSGEPIVCTPKEAVQDFYQMGLDALVIDDVVIEKSPSDG